MAFSPDRAIPKRRLEFLYDFEKKEFVLQFQHQYYAAAYQARNNEARILSERPREVWLPHAKGMKGLRSCSYGIAVVFESESAAEYWKKRTILGSMALVEGADPSVYIKREWSLDEFENKIGMARNEPPRLAESPNRRGIRVGEQFHNHYADIR
ncbi:hypothetical protein F5Y11DRAFT_333882 [Daldinia sp. FL1419]|nr:hypothetical protein F5Y11DRAFT_333882 [Daldinia sp. FL1419]